MNITHLGDALDHWKGCIIRLLEGHLHDVHVIPMFTDQRVSEVWTPSRLRLYSALLQLDIEASDKKIVQQTERYSAARRRDYFAAIANDSKLRESDFFVDPDTGIAPRSGGDTRHIRLTDLGTLLPPGSSRILLVYQHSSRVDTWTDACVQRVVNHNNLHGCSAFAYWAGSASMIFVGRESQAKRLASLHGVLFQLVSDLPKTINRVTDLVSHHP